MDSTEKKPVRRGRLIMKSDPRKNVMTNLKKRKDTTVGDNTVHRRSKRLEKRAEQSLRETSDYDTVRKDTKARSNGKLDEKIDENENEYNPWTPLTRPLVQLNGPTVLVASTIDHKALSVKSHSTPFVTPLRVSIQNAFEDEFKNVSNVGSLQKFRPFDVSQVLTITQYPAFQRIRVTEDDSGKSGESCPRVSFKTSHGTFLSCNSNDSMSSVSAEASAVGDRELFDIIPIDELRVSTDDSSDLNSVLASSLAKDNSDIDVNTHSRPITIVVRTCFGSFLVFDTRTRRLICKYYTSDNNESSDDVVLIKNMFLREMQNSSSKILGGQYLPVFIAFIQDHMAKKASSYDKDGLTHTTGPQWAIRDAVEQDKFGKR